ncbi:nucleotidyltransferase domain-containing protein [Streptomyces sp. MST-110588]|uniref:nucleotidyltransferase domain-containing protein n=1 Tax=Streptomyces sp. MST-110588 TaxID=2833628 RepID=UPI001F5C1487|nr:nucleotidyltransferase domain-containing protein [Streptomyces sp. MST-110588]UNO40698.1 nucleotidyltransferase domain-containing protein [Streptomyces sp. MST-110588]
MGAGLDAQGFFVREGSLAKVTAAFLPAVQEIRARIADHFDGSRLHSTYLYGSVPRGTALPGVSDLDVLLALRSAPTAADRAATRRVEAEVDARCPVVDGVGILLYAADTLLSEAERYDLGWFLACLCTPLSGPDLAEHLPRYRPTSLLARETNGDLFQVLPALREQAAAVATEAERTALTRRVARRLVRTGFTLVMPRWDGWTSDLDESAEVFGSYYPARAEQMRAVARAARTPADGVPLLTGMLDDLGPWLAEEYLAVHGAKTSRPDA